MRLLVLNDNVPSKGFLNDWGWSVLVEGKKSSSIMQKLSAFLWRASTSRFSATGTTTTTAVFQQLLS
ncbi:hypothetical protein [Thermococcus guaymasensis]|uniref:hypothetical protein n=1 Tax=Thermococcus guaymasensis TaxID=110164 RepID=UPI00316AD78A